MSERSEALVRIPMFIIGSIAVFLFKIIARLASLLNLFYTFFMNKRNEKLSYFCNLFCAFQYRYERYINFTTDKNDFLQNISKGVDPLDMEEW